MNRKLLLSLSLLALAPGVVWGAEDAMLKTAKITHAEMTQQSIQDKVRIFREERYEQMPYLDRGFVKSEITPEKIQKTIQFTESGAKDLEEMIDRAINVHTPTRAAKERINLARRRIIAAVRNLFPEVGLELQGREGSLTSGAFGSKNYRFSFRQPIFRGGSLWNTLLQEKSGLEASEKEFDAIVGVLVKDVSVAYFEYNRTSQVLKGQEAAIGRMQPYAKISEQKFKEQIISEIEHLNVQSLFGQMQYDYETSKQDHEIAKLNLQRYVDVNVDENLEIKPLYDVEDLMSKQQSTDEGASSSPTDSKVNDFESSIPILDVSELVDLAYENRPELRVESAKLQSARLAERIRWGQMVPRADMVLEFGKLGEAFFDVTRDPGLRSEFRLMLEFNWNAGGNKIGYTFENDERAPSVSSFLSDEGTQTTRNTVNLGLLDGLQDLVAIKEAEVSKLDQITELENAEKEVVQDVKGAYYDFQKAQIQVKSTLQRTNYRQRLRNLALHRLENNEIQISEFMQSEIDLLQELTALHKSLTDYYTAKAKLNHAIGMREYLPIEEKKNG